MIPASPLVEDHAVPLKDLYVQPPMTSFIIPNAFGQGNNNAVKETVSSYWCLLFSARKVPYKNIYVEANAGYGKTSFTQNIAMAWCQLYKVSEFDHRYNLPFCNSTFADIETLQRFHLLFLLHLRDFQDEDTCLLDELIIKFVAQSLPHSERFSEKFIKSILRTRPCLILCDGLDEWTHPSGRCWGKPGIPHNNYGDNCTILTTTRPWKLSTIGLTPNHIDQHVEISHLDKDTYKQLASNAVKLLCKNICEKERDLADFNRKVDSVKLGDIRMIPYILLQLICIWFDGISIGKSKCETYSNIIQLTLQRSLNKKNVPTLPTVNEKRNITVPECMGHNMLCTQYVNLLLKLGKLAFYTLFQNIKESSLVIERTTVLNFLTEQELEFCLTIGLLSQSKDRSKVSVKRFKVFFQHKSIQEFMAALYITSEWKTGTIQSTILEVCTSLSSILEMENIFVFVCGINPVAYTCISDELQKIVDLYIVTRQYRTQYRKYRTYCDYDDVERTMESYQSMQVQCLQESMRNGNENCLIPLYDILVRNNSLVTEEDLTTLKTIINFNKRNVKSLLLDRYGKDTTAFMQSLHPGVFTSLETLRVIRFAQEPVWLADILTKYAHTLKCLSLSTRYYSSLSDSSITALTGLTCLQSLYINNILMTHSNLSCLYAYICQNTTLTQLSMGYIFCNEHLDNKLDCEIALPQQRLNKLERVQVIGLEMSPSAWQKLLLIVDGLPLPVTVELCDCQGPSIEEWNTIVNVINSMPTLSLLSALSVSYSGSASLTLKKQKRI